RLKGESVIDTRGRDDQGPLPRVARAFLLEDVSAREQALHAIRDADVIVIGPGDLCTSIAPTLLVCGVPEAIRASRAEKGYVGKLMTKHGETDGFRAPVLCRELHGSLGRPLDRVIMHDGTFPASPREQYAASKQQPVKPDVETVRGLVPEVVVDALLALQGDTFVRH